MFITINKDGSVYAQSSEFVAFYNDQGKLSCSVSGRNVPEFININDHREKKSPNPDKNESPVKPIKITVDSTDLDKLEAQLKRIEGLMISTGLGLKQPAKGGFITDFVAFNHFGCLEPVFTNSTDRAFINGVFIDNAALKKTMTQAAKEGAKKGLEQARFEITTGVNDNREQVSAEMILKSSAKIAETSKTISREQSEFEKFKQRVESEFSQSQFSITAIQHTQANSEIASANAIEQIRAENRNGSVSL